MRSIPRRLLIMVALASALVAAADEPIGYYTPLNGKKDAELKTAIYNLVRNFTTVSSYNDLPNYFRRTDVRIIDGTSYWWDMYGNVPIESRSWSGSLLNREHSFPKSWWGGSTGVTAYVDLNHLYPADAAANMAKSNYPLGETSPNDKPTYDNGVSTIGYPVNGQGGGAPFVFEPDDEYKGDFARTYFYMVTCYQNLTWSSKYMYMLQQNTYPTLKQWAIDLLLKWHRDDPVSEKEIERNNKVYSIQNNRNPFIDRPELAEYIWGDKMGQTYTGKNTETTGDPVLITPVQDMALDFGQCAIGQTITRDLPFRGDNLKGTLELLVYRGAPSEATSMFKVQGTVSAQLVNNENGTVVKIAYTPSSTGVHTARLLISEGGLSGSIGVELRGEGFGAPTLSAPTAQPATNITNDSYQANWTSPSNEIIDYWIINRTKYVGSTVTTEQILAEEPGTTIDGFDESDRESYTVQSSRLGYTSAESNVIFVSHDAGVTGVNVDQPLIVQGFVGFMRFICSDEQRNARIYDMTGKLVMTIPEVYQNLDVEMSAGVYMVVTDQCARPVKVVVR